MTVVDIFLEDLLHLKIYQISILLVLLPAHSLDIFQLLPIQFPFLNQSQPLTLQTQHNKQLGLLLNVKVFIDVFIFDVGLEIVEERGVVFVLGLQVFDDVEEEF